MSPRRILFLLAGLAAATLLLAACGGDGDDDVSASDPSTSGLADGDGGDAASGGAASGGATRPWIGGTWALQSVTDGDAPVAIPTGAPLELTIAGPDQIDGDAGCNAFSGRIDAPFDGDRDGGSLSISDMSWTEMGCDNLDFEGVYLDLLMQVDQWELAPPSGLVFRGDGVELVYSIGDPPAELSLQSSTWILDTVFDGEGMERTASSVRVDKPDVTMTVAGETLTLAADGCAPIEVAVEADDGTGGPFLVAEPESLAGLVDCDDPESNLVTAIDGVAIATGYQSFDGRLTLIGLPGETLSFRAADG